MPRKLGQLLVDKGLGIDRKGIADSRQDPFPLAASVEETSLCSELREHKSLVDCAQDMFNGPQRCAQP